MRSLFSLSCMLAVTIGLSTPVFSETVNSIEYENQQLKVEVQSLRKELNEIKMALMANGIMSAKQEGSAKSVEKPKVSSKYDMNLYGRIRLSAGWDSSRMNNGNYAKWVESHATAESGDSELNMTARHSRLGVKLSGPKTEHVQTSGKVEVDFYEGGSENKNTIRMRHAYVKLDWPEEKISILAGQTYDLMFYPVFPETVSHNPMWWVGKYGTRRPQLRFTKVMSFPNENQWKNSFALARTMGDTLGNDPGDTGEDSGMPTFQARSSLKFSLFGKPAIWGVSGHYGQEEYDLNAGSDSGTDFKTESIKTHFQLQMTPSLKVKAELWQGKNLDTYAAGIGQGVNSTLLKPIRSSGGWSTITFHNLNGALAKWRFNLGYGQDNPKDRDLNAGNRSKNTVTFGNAIYSLFDDVSLGFEVSRWKTDYLGQEDAESTRFETYVNYSF